MEGKNRDPTGGIDDSTMVQPMWGAHFSGEIGAAQIDGHMWQYHRYSLTTEVCETVTYIIVNVVQIIREVGLRAGGGGGKVQMPWASPGPNIWWIAGGTAERQSGAEVTGAIEKDSTNRRGVHKGIGNVL